MKSTVLTADPLADFVAHAVAKSKRRESLTRKAQDRSKFGKGKHRVVKR